jgi:SAM-dependent methyltransferase/3-polyprenyl-4-hydroxybenzoate decarboxylase
MATRCPVVAAWLARVTIGPPRRRPAYARDVTDEPLRVRAPVVRIVDHGGSTTVIGPALTRRFDGDSAALLRAVLELHARPIGRTALVRALVARASAPDPGRPHGEPRGIVAGEPHREVPGELPDEALITPIDELVALLVAEGVLVPARAAPPPRPAGRLRRVVLGISGAVAAVDAPALIRGLHGAGCDVRVALTRNATRLVSRAALDALTHHAVWSGLWQRDASAPVPHVNLAEWAELVVVCPASATTLSRIATGDCSDLVAATVAATRAPVIIVPSMNDTMYESPAVQANLAALRDHGRHVVHPALGIELAHRPHARPSLLGPAPPASAVLDIVRHVLAGTAAVPRLPDTARGWEQLWASTPADRLPWHVEALDPPLAAAIAARHAPGRRLLDLGTGDGVVAIAAAQRGFRVTATDIAPSALGLARDRADRAGAREILFVLDDITAPRLDGDHDVVVDRGLLHCLPRDRRDAYAAGVTRLVSPGGALLVVAHQPGAALGTLPVTADELCALLPAFALTGAVPTTLAGAAAQLFELERRGA